MLWFIIFILILLALACGVVLVRLHNQRSLHRDAIHRRYALPDSDQRLPLLDPAAQSHPAPRGPRLIDRLREDESLALLSSSPDQSPPPPALVVATPDGDLFLTHPPFSLKPAVLPHKLGRYANALSQRLPPWIIVCPKVRLDAIVNPTNPIGRDPADWSNWRRRVRFRAVDFLLCDRRSWRPLLAILIDRPLNLRDLKLPAAGKDRLIDEVLNAANLPLIRASGLLHADWPLIEPYVAESILRTRDPCVEGDPPLPNHPLPNSSTSNPDSHQLADASVASSPAASDSPPKPLSPELSRPLDWGERTPPDAAVHLLNLDDEKGWTIA